MKLCPCCKQTLPAPLPPWGVEINGIKGTILKRVHKAGKRGIVSTDLFEHVYAGVKDPPISGLNCLSQQVIQLNRKLSTRGYHIHSTGRGGPGCHAVYSLVKL